MQHEEPQAPIAFDDAYYAKYTEGLGFKVVHLPAKGGKGIVALRDFEIGDEVLSERALAVIQNADEWAHLPRQGEKGVPVCQLTLRSLETPQDMLKRCLPKKVQRPDLPHIDSYLYPSQTAAEAALLGPESQCGVKCPYCDVRYVSEAARKEAWDSFHCVLCPGKMTEEQRAALEAFSKDEWTQGGVDYSDTFALALHYFARAAAAMLRNGGDMEAAWRPLGALISCPWENFRFGYLLTDDSAKPDEGPSKAEFLAHGVRLLHTLFPHATELITERRLSSTLGCVLLNGQERTPTSPWDDYVGWLENGAGGRMVKEEARREARKLRKSVERWSGNLAISTRGQATFRVGACFNHSCMPNVEVNYCAEEDETLYVTACREIKEGDELCISYIDETGELSVRQAHLFEHYLFHCNCPKCEEQLKQKK